MTARTARSLAVAVVGFLVLTGVLLTRNDGADIAGATTASPTSTSTAAVATTSAPAAVPDAASASTVATPVGTGVPSSPPAPVESSSTTTTTVPVVIDPNCPTSFHGAIVDRDRQRGSLCEAGVVVAEFPLTSAISQPDPGTYDVYAKDLNSSSNFSGEFSTMTHFVAFTDGEQTGARIAFHSMPIYRTGEFANPLATLGDLAYRGQSAGCLRVSPDDAVRIWDWLAIGDDVHVVS